MCLRIRRRSRGRVVQSPYVLFVIKRQLAYNGSPVPSKGLFNSAQFMVNALRRVDIQARLVEVVDGNDIDREVTKHGPTHCVLEALWVTPEKLAELQRLHPSVEFVVRLHSKMPFLATEGIALQWLREYDAVIATNAESMMSDLHGVLKRLPVFLPNIYQPASEPLQKKLDRTGHNVWIGSLGAIRPLKNQLLQAVAAIQYAEFTGRNCHFHINDRVEQGGEPVLKNIRALFANNGEHRLIEHAWRQNHEDVLHIVKSLDLSMQVSFSETFNIASADAVWQGVPIVVSDKVYWAPTQTRADPNSLQTMLRGMALAEKEGKRGTARNLQHLKRANAQGFLAWQFFLKGSR